MNNNIIVDVDQVVLNILPRWLSMYNRDYDDQLKEEDITSWGIHTFVKPECGTKIYDYLWTRNLYEKVPIVYGAYSGIKVLKDLGYRVLFVTASTNTWQREALKLYGLLEKNEDHIVSADKNLIRATAIIDDKASTIETFSQGLGILFDAAHNRKDKIDNKGLFKTRARGWVEVIPLLENWKSFNILVLNRWGR